MLFYTRPHKHLCFKYLSCLNKSYYYYYHTRCVKRLRYCAHSDWLVIYIHIRPYSNSQTDCMSNIATAWSDSLSFPTSMIYHSANLNDDLQPLGCISCNCYCVVCLQAWPVYNHEILAFSHPGEVCRCDYSAKSCKKLLVWQKTGTPHLLYISVLRWFSIQHTLKMPHNYTNKSELWWNSTQAFTLIFTQSCMWCS